MARGERTGKRLAQRIDMGYFMRPHPFRRWRLWLAIGVPLAALLWVGGAAVVGQRKLYSAGPVSSAHAAFGAQCQLCHATTLGFFRRHVKDQACLACHDGPAHQPNVTWTPACSSCHAEHQGPVRLAHVSEANCVQCHGDLKTSSGAPRFERSITGWDRGHPEIAVVRSGKPDPGTIKLNHQVHLKENLRGPRGLVQMDCADCHGPAGSTAPWPYAVAEARAAPAASAPVTSPEAAAPSRHANRTMVPPTYADTCAACHRLRFDARFPDEVPHAKPEIVRQFVRAKFADFIARNPGEVRRPTQSQRRLPDETPMPAPRNAEEWLAQQMAVAETLLWRKTCNECHTLTSAPDGLPRVQPPAITAAWMPHARFDHTAHRLLQCGSCHAAAKSQETADLLLPGVATCQQCHRVESTENRCFLCHTYHDWSKEKPTPGKFSLDDLVRGKTD